MRAELHTTELKEMEALLRNEGDEGDEVDNTTATGKKKKRRQTKTITVGAFLVMGLQLEEAQ